MKVLFEARPFAWLCVLLLTGCSSCRTRLPPGRVDLERVAENHELNFNETPQGKVRLSGENTVLVFEPGTRRFTLNGTTLFLNAPMVGDPRPHVADQDVLTVIRPLLNPSAFVSPRPLRIVMIDPGHGGKDSGALAPEPKLQEKDIVLDIALRVRKHVSAAGLEVKMIKKALGKDFVTVTPGIRPAWDGMSKDDQQRITTPAQAVKNGSDYLVIGRPIRDAKTPRDTANRIAKEIKAVL